MDDGVRVGRVHAGISVRAKPSTPSVRIISKIITPRVATITVDSLGYCCPVILTRVTCSLSTHNVHNIRKIHTRVVDTMCGQAIPKLSPAYCHPVILTRITHIPSTHDVRNISTINTRHVAISTVVTPNYHRLVMHVAIRQMYILLMLRTT